MAARPGAGGSGTAAAGRRPGPSGRPSQADVGSFLGVPSPKAGGSKAAERPGRPSAASAPKASTASSGGDNVHSKTIEGPGGGSATFYGGKGSTTTPGGATIGGGGAGVVVEGPGGGTHVSGVGGIGASKGDVSAGKVAGGSVTQGPGGVTTGHGGSISGVTGPRGSAVAAKSASGIKGPGGAAAGTISGGRAISAGGVTAGRWGTASGIRGPGGGAAVIGGGIRGVAVNGGQIAAVRAGFVGYSTWFRPGYYARYPGAWVAAGVAATAWWLAPPWGTAYGYCGCSSQPVSYSYGDTITYEDNTVYYGDQPVATAEQYGDQAAQIADSGAEATSEEWLPLGVYAVVTEGQTKADKVLQLAVNKEGAIRGNFHDTLTDKVAPVVGAVDKESQRVAIRPADGQAPVVECGLWNLTQDTLDVLVHLDKDRVETRALVRLQQPDSEG